jgi:hypothetical protein
VGYLLVYAMMVLRESCIPVIASQKLFCDAAALGTPFGDGIPMPPLNTFV